MTASPTVEELLTEAAAVARIPGRDADVRAWLRGLGIARQGAPRPFSTATSTPRA